LKVKISNSQTKSGQQLCSTNVNFDQYHVGKKLNKTIIEQNCCPDLVQLMLILTFLCTEKGPKNDLFFNCWTKSKQLSKKELSNIAPASNYPVVKIHQKYLCELLTIVNHLWRHKKLNRKNLLIVFSCLGKSMLNHWIAYFMINIIFHDCFKTNFTFKKRY
jgi:hypothetical protein